MINLFEEFQHLRGASEVDTPVALHLGHVPRVGELAYLHRIFKPTDHRLVESIGIELGFPSSVEDLYRTCNGANLFLGTIAIYGCVAPGTLLDRSKPFTLPPFNIMDWNSRGRRQPNAVVVGSYSFDRSFVCVDRDTEVVTCHVGEDFGRVRSRWPSLDAWLREELDRLPLFFSPEGEPLGPEEQLLPAAPSRLN